MLSFVLTIGIWTTYLALQRHPVVPAVEMKASCIDQFVRRPVLLQLEQDPSVGRKSCMKETGTGPAVGANPTPLLVVPKTGRRRVAVAGCSSYSAADVEAALTEVLEAVGGMSDFVKAGQTILVKPNLFGAHPPEHAATTHPQLVRQVVILCFKAGAGRVWVGDSPVSMRSEAQLWSRTGMESAVAGTGAELKSWQVKQTPLICGDDVLAVPEWYSQVDVVISLPKLKTHSLTTITCGLKNVYGMVSGTAKSQFHVKYPSPLAMSAFLVRVFARLQPQLTIADAVMAMEGNGPAHGRPSKVGLLLASRDPVALDAVACTALRIPPAMVPMIRLAAADGLGVMDESAIDCVGSGASRLKSVSLKPSVAKYLGRVPEPLFRLSTRFLRLRPKIKNRLCAKCGICTGICPKKAIRKDERTGYPRIDQAGCIDCFCCVESCPDGAIAVQLYLGNLLCIAQQKQRKVVGR
jgi:uncharacterized protein (DUF362 family)/Pyruvate/2-oxoacid:ferredoxin oxidoreductase delta subunit